jgi:RimJ/RimL family protein N-acetyltransferase
MVKLIPIEKDMDISHITDEPVKSNLELTFEYYEKIGFAKPWISYLIEVQDECVGICAFKGKPVDNRVEIAYHTFPAYEGQGIATQACKMLVDIAQNEDQNITITARTLPEKNASTSVLTKNKFNLTGTVMDPDDGEVFEWVFAGV